MNSKPRRRSKISARQAMHVKRAAAPEIDTCPPGGQYKPLGEHDLQQIYQTALRILSELGMGDVPARLQQKALEFGAHLNKARRLCYPNSMVEDMIDGACRDFVFLRA